LLWIVRRLNGTPNTLASEEEEKAWAASAEGVTAMQGFAARFKKNRG